MDELTGEQILVYEEMGRIGDKITEFLNTEYYALLEDKVFKPIEQRAFLDFAQTPATDLGKLALCQAVKLGIDRIREKLRELEMSGTYAKEQLLISTRKDENYA